MYCITEPFDGSRIRVIACARTRERAEAQYEREATSRARAGYGFFCPLRRVVASSRRALHRARDAHVATLPTWNVEG